MLVRDIYFDCLQYEESTLCYYLFHLLQENKCTLDDHISKINLNQADHEKVAEMIHTNLLGFHPIKIFSLKMNDEKFVFIFAESVLDAVIHYVRTYRIPPLNCHEYSLDIEIIKKNEVMTFREMKKQHFKFPAITGVYLRDNF